MTLTSHWRCDGCGETITLSLDLVLLDEEGKVEGPAPPGVDVVVGKHPCPICGVAMRRVESPGDLRDWGASFQ